MSAVLIFVVPAYLLMALLAALTRPIAVTPSDLALGIGIGVLAVAAYGFNRTEHYQRGAVLLTITAIAGTAIVGYREPDPTRALYSALISITGPLYASFLLSARATLIASLATLGTTVGVVVLNPAISPAMAVIPLFFTIYVLSLTVVSARLRERQVEELEQGSALLRSTLDASQDAAIIIDRKGRVTEWSLVAARLLGVTQLEALGKELLTLVKSETELRLDGGQTRYLEFDATRLDGARFPCEGFFAALPDGRTAVFLRDVSERKQMEARLMMSDRLETMGRMVAGVAHEINNPLAYVIANLNYLKGVTAEGETSGEEVQAVLAETSEGARRIQAIVQDLRIFSRSGEFEAVTPLSVEAVLDSVVTIAQPRLREARATVRREYGNVGNVFAIESRLAQVFLNLIVNAAQALIETSKRDIVVSTKVVEGRVIIGIRDFGPGIPEAARGRLFSPFFTTKPAGQGTGLGLYISQNIVSGLKGELRVESSSEGTLFEVVLPVAAES